MNTQNQPQHSEAQTPKSKPASTPALQAARDYLREVGEPEGVDVEFHISCVEAEAPRSATTMAVALTFLSISVAALAVLGAIDTQRAFSSGNGWTMPVMAGAIVVLAVLGSVMMFTVSAREDRRRAVLVQLYDLRREVAARPQPTPARHWFWPFR